MKQVFFVAILSMFAFLACSPVESYCSNAVDCGYEETEKECEKSVDEMYDLYDKCTGEVDDLLSCGGGLSCDNLKTGKGCEDERKALEKCVAHSLIDDLLD